MPRLTPVRPAPAPLASGWCGRCSIGIGFGSRRHGVLLARSNASVTYRLDPSTSSRRMPATALRMTVMNGLPGPQGLYHPDFEHDACGVGFICHIKGKASHQIVSDALQMLENMNHRGA